MKHFYEIWTYFIKIPITMVDRVFDAYQDDDDDEMHIFVCIAFTDFIFFFFL